MDRHALKQMAKVYRNLRLEREFLVGTPKSKKWGGKSDHKQDRIKWKQKDRLEYY